MLSRGTGPFTGMLTFVLKGTGVSLGIVGLAGSGAIAAPLFPGTAQQPQTAQQTQTGTGTAADGDVIVDTSPRPTSPTGSTSSPSTLANTRFTCESNGGQYVVMYHPESQPGQSYPWATPATMGGGWTPQLRCNEISRRLESYRPDGLLEMRTATENGYNTVCVTTQKVPSCRIVLTVPPGQDPTITRDRVFQNLTVADSGQQTQAVNTFVAGERGNGIVNELGKLININLPELGGQSNYSDGINLRPFLDRNDGGTGEYLHGSASNRPAPRLNPNRFR